MKESKQTILGGAVCLIITFLFICWLSVDFASHQKNRQEMAYSAFIEAIQLEKDSQLKDVPKILDYKTYRSPDNIPLEEKNNWCDQWYLAGKDSNRIKLDSCFRVTLAKRNIDAQIAVHCLLEGRTTYSCPDSLYYREAEALPPVVYRLSEKPEERCELQGYVAFSFLSVLMHTPSMRALVLLWFLSICVAIGTFYYWKKAELPPLTCKFVRKPIAKEIPITKEVPDLEPWRQLPAGWAFNEKYGQLKKKDLIINLQGNELQIVLLFLQYENYYVPTKTICIKVLRRKVDDEPTDSDKNAAAVTISRLRNELEPFAKIKAIRHSGYRLIVKPDESAKTS